MSPQAMPLEEVGAVLAPSAPCTLARARSLRILEAFPEGLDAGFHWLLGCVQRWRLHERRLQDAANAVSGACDACRDLSARELDERIALIASQLRLDPAKAQGQLVAGLGAIGELARRQLGMTPYPVQFMGVLALHEGFVAEMATGEGKTLTVGLAAALSGMSGRPCHVITANDYLAERDAQQMTPLLEACGLSVSSISSALDQAERASRYDASVVYVTAKELLADYLRDSIGAARDAVQAQQRFLRWSGAKATGNAPTDAQPCLRRGLHSAIVDEADSVLIDEAVTPLILAVPRQSRGLADATRQISLIAARLEPGADYTPRPQTQTVVLHESAVALLDEAAAALPALWQPAERREELLRQALVVRCFYRTGHHYVVQEGQVVLLDESTGRMTPGRSLTAGLHQAIEAAEGLEITDPNQSLTQMSFQTFFRRFRRLSGCSGTVWEARHELWRIYERVIVRVPTHRPRITHYRDPVLTLTGAHKWDRIAREVADLVERGRPVLVGVRSVPSSEALARVLAEHACPARVLNALTHQEEAQIIAQAGQGGTVTIATNMAGRGTDVKLGPGVAERGGLHVIIAESNESGRIDRQLAGRCGRQGDPGSVSIYQCMTDDLAIRMMPDWLRRLVLAVGRRSAGRSSFLARCAFRQAQRRAEALAYQRRVGVLKIDQWMRSALPFEGRASERGS